MEKKFKTILAYFCLNPRYQRNTLSGDTGGDGWFAGLSFPSVCRIVKQMPAKAKKFLITTETHEIFIVRRNGRDTVRGYCGFCGREVEMLSIDAAVIVTGIRSLELFKLLESERVHYVESTQGHVLICEPSLKQVARSDFSNSHPQIFLSESDIEGDTEE